jgi:hypothetical protein
MTDEMIPPSDTVTAPETSLGKTPAIDTPTSASAEPTPASAEPALLANAPEPIAYETFKLPEGTTVDGDSLAAATELFRSSALSQEQAQKFIDLAVSREQAAAQKGAQAFADLQNRWVSEIKADPDIGGERLTASLASASRAIDRLGVLGLREALNLTGAGNHPAVVKAFVRLGQMVSEDRFLPGRDAAPAAPRSPAEVIYDGSPRQ